MRSPEQVKWDFVQAWIRKAETDLSACRSLVAADLPAYYPAAFQAQQAAEKFLKALLTCHQVPFGKTHEIGKILALAGRASPGIEESLSDADRLTPYGVDVRYPADQPEVNRDEAQTALHLAEKVRETILGVLKPYLDAGRP